MTLDEEWKLFQIVYDLSYYLAVTELLEKD
jgi:hypothetical protein